MYVFQSMQRVRLSLIKTYSNSITSLLFYETDTKMVYFEFA